MSIEKKNIDHILLTVVGGGTYGYRHHGQAFPMFVMSSWSCCCGELAKDKIPDALPDVSTAMGF